MTKKNEIYYCDLCGNIVEVLSTGKGTLVCCGKDMELLDGNTTEAATEKHIPVVTKDGDKITVTVGSTEHPMTEKHYIEWIELIAGSKVYRKDLTPEDKPEAVFTVCCMDNYTARAYCNLHGLWKAEGK